MTLDQWLLGIHMTGAFLVLGGTVMALTLEILALRSARPSEVALFRKLTQVAVICIGLGVIVTLAIGLWLVHRLGYAFGQAWIVISILLWVASTAAGGIGGRRDAETRLLAERLAAEGDSPSPELSARLRNPVTLAFSWGSGVGILAILALMVWKPGA